MNIRPLKPQSIRSAMTLVELVTVLAIIGVLSTMALPRYGNAVNRYRVDAAARRVAADLAFAQSRARALSTSRSVVFDINDGTYLLSSETGLSGENTYTIDLTADPYRVSIATASFGTTASAGTATVTFNGFGYPAQGGYLQLQSGSASRTISIDATSGAATVQ